MKGTVLIAGASGLVGAAAVESFLADGYDVIALSRRRPEVDSAKSFTHSALDLRDGAACRDAAKGFSAVTHVVYTAVFELPGLVPGWSEKIQMDTNLAMLQNLIDPLSQNAKGLKHVSLLQGTKAYGVHLHKIRIPARERFPRDQHEARANRQTVRSCGPPLRSRHRFPGPVGLGKPVRRKGLRSTCPLLPQFGGSA